MTRRNKIFVHKSRWLVVFLAQRVVSSEFFLQLFVSSGQCVAWQTDQRKRICLEPRCTASTKAATFSGGVY